ncbi:MAG: hypothetical protein ACKOCM_11365, partial [Cyanobacteriota bacterium]
VELLPASAMPGAAGAYAVSTGTIYLNAHWLANVSTAQVLAVLTEELGHHLDGLLNASDTPGDEGELFAALLHGDGVISTEQRQQLLKENDHGRLLVEGEVLAVEQATLTSTPIPVVNRTRTRGECRNGGAFAALRADGSVVTWGDVFYGGNSSGVASQLGSGVVQIFSTGLAFAALKSDGSVVTWGGSFYGGDSSGVASQLSSGITQIFSNARAFAALKADGSVVTWGYSSYGGDSSGVASQLTGVVAFANPFTDDRLIFDSHPTITLAVSPASVTEDGTTNLVFTFSRTGLTTTPLTVNSTVSGTATLGSDYTGIDPAGATKTVTFAAGAATATVAIDPLADASLEPDEAVALTITPGAGYMVGTNEAVTSTILNDDTPLPVATLSIATDLTAGIGRSITVPIRLDQAAGVEALDLTVAFDPLLFSVLDAETTVSAADLTGGWSFVTNTSTPGRIVIAGYGTQAIDRSSGTVATLQLMVNQGVLPGDATLDLVSARLNEGQISANLIDGTLHLIPASLQVLGVRPFASGIAITLSEAPDLTHLNLYDGPDPNVDAPDLQLINHAGQPVDKLSLHWEPGSHDLYLIRSDTLTGLSSTPFQSDRLAADQYTLSIESRSDGLISALGATWLDGNRDGITGDAFSTTFTTVAPSHLIAIGDTTRGPGQTLSLNGAPYAAGLLGLPVQISTSASLTRLHGSLRFDASTFHDVTLIRGVDLPTDWVLQLQVTTPGTLSYSASGTTAITGSNRQLFRFLGTVAPSAPYGSTTLVQATAGTDQNPDLIFATDPGLVVVAYSGDATGNGATDPGRAYSSLDASRIQRVVVGLDSGFDAYDRISPILISDVTGNGSLSSLDASRLSQQVVGLPVTSFPALNNPLLPV